MLVLKGGYRGFKETVRAGFTASMHNPTIRYSHIRGFHLESGLSPKDPDVIWEQQCYYNLNNDGERVPRPTLLGYKNIREEIQSKIDLQQAREESCD